jgi:NTP pyrophosphatase (non-canonical NTP hydrolase)
MDMFEGLKQIARKCWETSESKGWHKETREYKRYEEKAKTAPNIELQECANDMLDALGGERARGVPVMSKLMLIVTEVAEAAEVFRDAKQYPSLTQCYELYAAGSDILVTYKDDHISPLTGERSPLLKPEGFGSELADIVIRVFDLAEDLGIDIAAEIRRKMRYNESRAYRHGGKVA